MSFQPTFRCLNSSLDVFEHCEFLVVFPEPITDPFRRVLVHGHFVDAKGTKCEVEGFCDSADGCVHRLRFMPTNIGLHRYRVSVRLDSETWSDEGMVDVDDQEHPGILRSEGWHFRFSRGDYFFWNATTAYLMPGLSESSIVAALDRLAGYDVNRIRVSLCPSRQPDGRRWHELQVAPREDFTYSYSPWLDAKPDDILNPQWDLNRFNIPYWQKFERLVAAARIRNIQVQVIFFTDAQEDQNYPFDRQSTEDIPEEQHYYRYAIARLASFSNVEWCVTNEWAVFRSDDWANRMGAFVASLDPYRHLLSVHGHGHFPFRAEAWPTHTLFQVWDEDGAYDWVTEQRRQQLDAGRALPIVNEEYGYEDHYPVPWGGGRDAPARNADSRRRLAWEITMAGGYQTTGESAANGLGGWINGFGDDSMTMLKGYQILKEFFESIQWWQLTPIVNPDASLCRVLACEGLLYVAYLPSGEIALPTLPTFGWEQSFFNPRTGEHIRQIEDDGDWVVYWKSPEAASPRAAENEP